MRHFGEFRLQSRGGSWSLGRRNAPSSHVSCYPRDGAEVGFRDVLVGNVSAPGLLDKTNDFHDAQGVEDPLPEKGVVVTKGEIRPRIEEVFHDVRANAVARLRLGHRSSHPRAANKLPTPQPAGRLRVMASNRRTNRASLAPKDAVAITHRFPRLPGIGMVTLAGLPRIT